ncbi:8249_t:CDS:2 [Diversispora eburnea]|uniref:8249_t:CDS:1 n=1 Tax=Diversispora eburnea TaxID=1213867 RepID=A0A9N9G2X4_9GLOM|nr:8249_t:CDS:2 [Diversispora eburnea]
MVSECTIPGTDIVSPRIRVSIYVQSSLVILKLFSNQKKYKICVIPGGNIVHLNNISHNSILQQQPTLFISNRRLLISFASLLITCYSTWIWTTIKWKLPEQECGDKVRVFWLTIPLNPIGWVRIFTLISLSVNLLILFVIFLTFAVLMGDEGDDDGDKGDDEGDDGDYDGRNITTMAIRLCCLAIPYLVLLIVSSEILIHRNPISEIPANWGIKEIVILILSGGDVTL